MGMASSSPISTTACSADRACRLREKLFHPRNARGFIKLAVKARHQQAGITGIVQLVQRMARAEVRPNQILGKFEERHRC